MNDVCSGKKRKEKNQAKKKKKAVVDESQMKFGCFFIPSSGMKKQSWRNGVYQTNDGKLQEVVRCSRQSPCQR